MTDPITARRVREVCKRQREEQMLDITNAFRRWDVKFLYEQHCKKQQMFGREPVCYKAFLERLKVMSVREAIYKERENNRSHKWGRKMNRKLTKAELQARQEQRTKVIATTCSYDELWEPPVIRAKEKTSIRTTLLNRFKNLFK